MIEALDIRVRGIVQGVGFRPFVYRLARRHIVSGWVLNDLEGVFIHAEAETRLLDEFVAELHLNPPAAARIDEIDLAEVSLLGCDGFEILESASDDADKSTLVSADLGICDDCLNELHDPSDRRFRYPFINCTNCGPRFTIIDSLPYDRQATSMRGFEMCEDCTSEYHDPGDRRFHAQPNACFECGPQLSLWMPEHVRDNLASGFLGEFDERGADALRAGEVLWAHDRSRSDAILAACVSALQDGGILAVKGIGGFHLACDGLNASAIARLRERKHRDGKALAVMVATVEDARVFCEVSEAEKALMESPARPIVLLRKRTDVPTTAGLADGLPELGVMLPATPVQSLLMSDFARASGSSMLVMTSGNVHDEPIVIDDAQAREKLGPLADAVLGNDREILSRYDDSVTRVLDLGGEEAIQFIRRARGYAPTPVPLKVEAGQGTSLADRPVAFAAGSEQKNTFAYSRAGEVFVSQHIGDMEDADVYDVWLEAKSRMERLFDLSPRMLACDLHPEYLSSKWARSVAYREGMRLNEVQHHHAHIASVLGEHGLFGPCCGIAFDGTGFGADGSIWGGEVLLANQVNYERFANFSYAPMPGGAAAIKNPARMAFGFLWAYDLLDHPGAAGLLQMLGDQAGVCEQMIENGLNTPYTSSVGRLFDAVSALLGVCASPTYEGEAAILLDAVRASDADASGEREGAAERYAVVIAKNAATETSTAHDTSVVLLDAQPTLRAVLDDMLKGVPVSEISCRFHDALVGAVVQVAELVRTMYDISLVALSGGCFMNRYLVEKSVAALGERGFTVALNGDLPPNDGCVSYGQAVIASVSR